MAANSYLFDSHVTHAGGGRPLSFKLSLEISNSNVKLKKLIYTASMRSFSLVIQILSYLEATMLTPK